MGWRTWMLNLSDECNGLSRLMGACAPGLLVLSAGFSIVEARATVRCRSLFGGLASTGLLGGTQLITRRSRDGHPFSGTMIEIRLVVFIVRIDVSWGADQDGCVQVVQESYRSFIPLHSVSVHNKAQLSAHPAQL